MRRGSGAFLHGGGWGIGPSRRAIPTLTEAGWALDVVVYGEGEAPAEPGTHRYHRIAPSWRPWRRDESGELGYPPLETMSPEHGPVFVPQPGRTLFDVIEAARVIVSKPGGSTLIDSLAAATPIAFLEPYGPAEAANARLWTRLGGGLDFATWAEHRYSAEALESLHATLARMRRDTPLYLPVFAAASEGERTAGLAGSRGCP
ncbi:MAG: hypothetical protein IPN34_13885 [Planctomycetes bacterium]|nr:hypothetical protein [Planctomycetota bacterium]